MSSNHNAPKTHKSIHQEGPHTQVINKVVDAIKSVARGDFKKALEKAVKREPLK